MLHAGWRAGVIGIEAMHSNGASAPLYYLMSTSRPPSLHHDLLGGGHVIARCLLQRAAALL